MHLGFNDLTGTIPWQIGELQRLQEIVLEGNNLHGSIPVGFGQCSRLQKLKLRTNKLNGALPSDLYDCVELKVLQVGDNTLNGTISLKIGNLSDLTWCKYKEGQAVYLFVTRFHLTCPIATSIHHISIHRRK